MGQVKLVVWNMEWLNNLFKKGPGGAPVFKDDNEKADRRGRQTVGQRKELLARGIAHLDADLMVVVEGPNETDELDLLFRELARGTWSTYAQKSVSPNGPGRSDTYTSTQCVGIAIRTDKGRFAAEPMNVFDAMNPDQGLIHTASEPFFYDTGQDKVPEWYRFDRRPLYVEVEMEDGALFRVLGLHLKSKAIFSTYEWSRYWAIADANRERLLAQCRHLREEFLDIYLTDRPTRDIPLVVCGDINDGPGFDTSEMRLKASAVETLMGSVWKPPLTLGNALFDRLEDKDKSRLDFSKNTTTSFEDPIFDGKYHHVWIDHVMYSRNTKREWISKADIVREIPGTANLPYKKISDHYPVQAVITLELEEG